MDKDKQNNKEQHENYIGVGIGLGAAMGSLATSLLSCFGHFAWSSMCVPAGLLIGMLIGMLIPKKK